MANDRRRKREAWDVTRDNRRHHEWRDRDARERAREDTLADWYGDDRAAPEVEAHQPGERSIGQLLGHAFEQLNAGDYPLMRKIIENWRQIMGAQFMQYAEPRRIQHGTLYVEVFQAVHLYPLRTHALPLMRERLHALTDGRIRDVRLVPGGATPRAKR